MLEQFAGDDDIERRIGERQRLVDVRPHRLDAELRRFGERLAIHVHTDDLVAVDVRAGQRSVAAAEVEHAPATSDELREELGALGAAVDELAPAARAVVLAVAVTELLEPGHGSTCARRGAANLPVSRIRWIAATSAADARTQRTKSQGTR